MVIPNDEDFDPKVAALIRQKAKQLARTSAFNRSDEEDLRQELWLQVIAGLKRHDPSRSSRRTFASRIVVSRAISIAVHATALKRHRRFERPINDAPERLLAGHRQPSPQQIELAFDVREALATLPGDLRAAAAALGECTEAQFVRRTRTSRQRVRGMRQLIAKHLLKNGVS